MELRELRTDLCARCTPGVMQGRREWDLPRLAFVFTPRGKSRAPFAFACEVATVIRSITRKLFDPTLRIPD